MTNGGFSDSQFGDIADEENYTGAAPIEVFANPSQAIPADHGNEDTSTFVNYGRPTAAVPSAALVKSRYRKYNIRMPPSTPKTSTKGPQNNYCNDTHVLKDHPRTKQRP